MAEFQKNKIEYKNAKGEVQQVFFFEHSLKSALQHAQDFIARNTGRLTDMRIFDRNMKNFGPTWIRHL